MATIKIFSWNVNGIRSVINKGDFLKFINKYQPDILCLQETKATQGQVEIDLKNYYEYWNSADKKGYSGTAIFSKIRPLKVINDLSKDLAVKFGLVDKASRDANNEGRVITAEYQNFFLVNVYTPNAKDDLSRIPLRQNQWDPAFLAHCKDLEREKPVIFCGDLNVAYTADDLARPKPNEGKKGYTIEEREGFGNFIKAGFVDSFRLFYQGNGHYTWWTHWAKARERNVGWRIDYFLSSEKLVKNIISSDIHSEVMGSDHAPISLVLDI